MKENNAKKSHAKLVALLLVSVVIIAGLVLYFGVMRPYKAVTTSSDIKIEGVYLSAPIKIHDFQLADQHNNPFTKDNLKGHWTMLFFGFTSCPKICPVTLVALKKMYLELQKKLSPADLPHVVFVTVDPDKDTNERLKNYVSAFHPDFIGARADIKETIRLENELHIAAAKLQVDGQGSDHYTINHSTEILLFNPNAELQAYLSSPIGEDHIVSDYMTIIQKNNKS